VSKPFTPKTLRSAGWIAAALSVAAIALIAFGNAGLRTLAAKAAPPTVASTAKLAASSATKPAMSPAMSPEQRSRVHASLGALPLAFEANVGQSDPQVKYMARGNGYTLFLTGSDAVFAVHSAVPSSAPASATAGKFHLAHARQAMEHRAEKTAAIRMQLVGGNSNAQIAAGSELPGRINYYIGNDRSQWHEGVKQYAAVDYRNVYPGVDLRYHGEQRQLEFDFIVSPEANAAPIDLGFKGASKIATDATGNLILSSSAGDVMLHKPVAYQDVNGQRQLVDAAFRTNARNEVTIALGTYDHSRELVIDPALSYATYLGGASEDEVFGISVDSSNNIFVTGESNSTSGFPGGNVSSSNGYDVFVTSVSSAGALTYTTFVGGSGNDSGLGIATDSSGAAYVTGITESNNFPTSSNAPQPQKGDNGGNCTNLKKSNQPCTDAFAFKLNASGSISGGWCTYVGGINDDDGYAIALDSSGNVWVAGDTFSSSFYPNNHATTVLYPTFNAGVTLSPPADDGFVVEVNSAGTAFGFSTYLGGNFSDQANGIVADGSGNIYVTGETASTDFPTAGTPYKSTCGSDGNCNAHAGQVFYDGFVTKIAAGGASLTYSTYIGGSSDDYAFAIALDSAGDTYITGETTQDDTATTPAVPYPTTTGAFSTTYNSSATANAFVTELNPAGSALLYSTFLGGSVQDYGGGIAVDSSGDAYVTGTTSSADFPVTSNAFQSQLNGNGQTGQSDAFVTQVVAGGASLGVSSYLGGSGSENANASGSVGVVALDGSNNMWLGGSTNSATSNSTTNFPVTSNALESTYGGNPYDGFVAEVSNVGISATTPAAVNPGSSGTSTVTLTSLPGYTLQVTLSCSVTGSGSPLPACSASSFSPGQVTPTSSGANSTLTITTTGSSAALYRKSNFVYAMWLPVVGLSLIGMRFTSKDSRKKKLLGFLLLGVVMAMLFFLPACGGGSSGSGGGGGGGSCTGCTPAGSYTVTITGTDTNNLSTSTSVTLTVN
jgi:hypothetical protein